MSQQFVAFVLTPVSWFPTVIFGFFLPKIFFSFSYKKIIFESKSIGVHKVRGSFRCTRLETMGYRILGEERN